MPKRDASTDVMHLMQARGLRLPHEGHARYPITQHVVLIDLDDNHIVMEVHEDYIHELPGMEKSFALKADNLLFVYYLKTAKVWEIIKAMRNS